MAANALMNRVREFCPTISVGMLTADLLSLGSELALIETAGVKLLVEFNTRHLELTVVFRVLDEPSVQHQRLTLVNDDTPGKLNALAALRYEPSGGEVGG